MIKSTLLAILIACAAGCSSPRQMARQYPFPIFIDPVSQEVPDVQFDSQD